MYAFEECNKSMCKHVICDAHNKRIITNKIRETYAMSIKTGQSGLGNRIIRFCQQNHKKWNIRFIKLDSPVFPDIGY
jgi:hypothetical protein